MNPTEFRAGRLLSMDAYRGFVMLLMMAEVLQFERVSEALPGQAFWQFLAFHQSHAEWLGCSLHDLIQPSFSFLVGVALPYSLASRISRGETTSQQVIRTLRRSLVLIFLGIFLRSMGREQTNFTFEDTLTQIGLGYPFLVLLGHYSPNIGWIALVSILVGYWVAFVAYPVASVSPQAVGVPVDWPYHFQGIAAHFNKNTNLAWAFDTWFLNLFPREKPFLFNGGGYATLSFIPTLGTMILGLQAGRWVRNRVSDTDLLRKLLIAGIVGLALGWLLSVTGICPSVKRIWTPSWVLFSGGWCFVLLALFYLVIDVVRWQRWAFPLIVIGMNSIAAYGIAHLFEHFIAGTFHTHFGANVFQIFGEAYEPLMQGIAVLAVYWLLLWWMYRRNIFIRI